MQTSPSDTTTTLSYQRERKLCNRVSGVLLAYLLLMNLVVIAVMLVEVCVELIRLTGLGYNLNCLLYTSLPRHFPQRNTPRSPKAKPTQAAK